MIDHGFEGLITLSIDRDVELDNKELRRAILGLQVVQGRDASTSGDDTLPRFENGLSEEPAQAAGGASD